MTEQTTEKTYKVGDIVDTPEGRGTIISMDYDCMQAWVKIPPQRAAGKIKMFAIKDIE